MLQQDRFPAGVDHTVLRTFILSTLFSVESILEVFLDYRFLAIDTSDQKMMQKSMDTVRPPDQAKFPS